MKRKKLLKRIGELFFLIITLRPITRPIKYWLLKEYPLSKKYKQYKYDNNVIVRDNSILIFEPNTFHGEILPGYVKYCLDLGYNVDVLVRYENIDWETFSRISDKRLRVFGFASWNLKKILKSKQISQYENILITSSCFMIMPHGKRLESFAEFLNDNKIILRPGNKVLLVEHDPRAHVEKYDEYNFINENRLFVLAKNYYDIPILCPAYFGDIDKTRRKNKTVGFICTGTVWAKDTDQVYKSIDKLLSQGIDNFRITICGGGKFKIPEQYKKYIRFMGFIKFSEMYELLERADFILGLLDVFKQNDYLHGKITGNLLQAFGFATPIILNRIFAENYGLSEKDTIMYDKKDLYPAMFSAIKMTASEYDDMRGHLIKLAENISNESITNLKKSIKC